MNRADTRLTPPLSADRRAALPDWLGGDVHATLDAPQQAPIAAMLAAARVLRGGAGEPEDRSELSRWIAGAMRGALVGAVVERGLDASSVALDALMQLCASSAEARATLAVELGREVEVHDGAVAAAPQAANPVGAAPDPEAALRAVWARDEVESAAWALGLAVRDAPQSESAAVGEARVLEAAAGIDEIGQALRTELARALRGQAPDPWLPSVATLEDGWWLDAWSEHAIGADDLVALFAPPASNVVVLRVPSPRLEQAMAAAASDGTSAMERALEAEPGPVLARLLGGDVEVYAVGLDGAELPPGLIVQPGEGVPFVDLTSVRLDPPGTAPPERDAVAEAWWVPLGGSGSDRRALAVTLADGRSARLEIAPE